MLIDDYHSGALMYIYTMSAGTENGVRGTRVHIHTSPQQRLSLKFIQMLALLPPQQQNFFRFPCFDWFLNVLFNRNKPTLPPNTTRLDISWKFWRTDRNSHLSFSWTLNSWCLKSWTRSAGPSPHTCHFRSVISSTSQWVTGGCLDHCTVVTGVTCHSNFLHLQQLREGSVLHLIRQLKSSKKKTTILCRSYC